MAQFRVETVFDENSGCYFAELYYPSEAAEPVAATDPIYPSHEVAEKEILKLFQEAIPSKS